MYSDYHAYSEKKKAIENGQFFTSPDICRLVAESLRPSHSDLIADLTCGKGSFFNFLPMEDNLYGCELDAKAAAIAGIGVVDIFRTDPRLIAGTAVD